MKSRSQLLHLENERERLLGEISELEYQLQVHKDELESAKSTAQELEVLHKDTQVR